VVNSATPPNHGEIASHGDEISDSLAIASLIGACQSELAMPSNRPALPLTGGCICGAVRYEIASFPLLLYTCNCTNCQKQSGSAFGMTMPVTAKDFRIVQGEPNGWRRLSPAGVAVTSWFCGNCGNRIYSERAGRLETVNIRAGTLDDTTWLPGGRCRLSRDPAVRCPEPRSGLARPVAVNFR
jgi:hypothetical protein